MPNHISNRLRVLNRANEVLDFLKGDETLIDFNKIIPMPEGLDIEESSTGDDGMEYLLAVAGNGFSFERKAKEIKDRLISIGYFDSAIELGKKYLMNIAKTGHKTWYRWSVDNWGTKWNAYSSKMTHPNCIEFQTAWSGVPKLIEKLSLIFPDVSFEYEFADEDSGSNCASYKIFNGVITGNPIENRSKEAYELYFSFNPEARDEYRFENGTYIYIEEEE